MSLKVNRYLKLSIGQKGKYLNIKHARLLKTTNSSIVLIIIKYLL